MKDFDATNVIRRELDPGETLLWAGKPRQGTRLQVYDVFMIPFSLMWGGFAVFWESSALRMAFSAQDNHPGFEVWIFPLFGIPFVLIGLYMIFGRFLYDSRNRKNTFYGLTDHRAIIVSGLFGKTIKSLDLKTLHDLSLSEKSNNTGTITFGQDNPFLSLFGGNGFPGMGGMKIPKFEFIEDSRKVYNQIREQQKGPVTPA